jgi:endo-1,4-beta-D-glucanase Y
MIVFASPDITLRQKRNETTYSSVYHPFFTADSLSLVLKAPAWRLAFDVIGRIQVLATFPQHPFLVMYHGRFSRPP